MFFQIGQGPGEIDNKQAILINNWNQMFVQHGGLRHLFDIFMSGKALCCLYSEILSKTAAQFRVPCLEKISFIKKKKHLIGFYKLFEILLQIYNIQYEQCPKHDSKKKRSNIVTVMNYK